MVASIPERADSVPEREDLASEALDGMRVLVRRARRVGRGHLEPLGITPGRLGALRAIRRLAAETDGRPVRMGQVARALDIVPRSATDLVTEIEELGLARRGPDPLDGRAISVSVTAAGEELLAAVAEERRAVALDLLAALDERELRDLADLIGRALDRDAPPAAERPGHL